MASCPARARDQARHQMRIAGAEDQMRPQSHGGQRAVVGCEHEAFGLCLAGRIRRQEARSVGQVIGCPAMIGAVEGHAGGAGEDQLLHAAASGRIEHALRTGDIGVLERLASHGDAGLGGAVKHDLAALHGAHQPSRVGQIEASVRDAECFERGVVTARDARHRVAALHKLAHDRAAHETAAAGHQRLHLKRSSAQSLSSSRRILALWRTSTGKCGWNRTRSTLGSGWGSARAAAACA